MTARNKNSEASRNKQSTEQPEMPGENPLDRRSHRVGLGPGEQLPFRENDLGDESSERLANLSGYPEEKDLSRGKPALRESAKSMAGVKQRSPGVSSAPSYMSIGQQG